MQSLISVHLKEDELPTQWYNILPDLPEPLPPPLDPATMQPIDPSKAETIFANELVSQKVLSYAYRPILDEVLDINRIADRSTAVHRARRLVEYLNTPAEIY